MTLIITHQDIEGPKGRKDIITTPRMLSTRNESQATTIGTHTTGITIDPISRIINVRATIITIAVTREARVLTTRRRRDCITIESAVVGVAAFLRLAVAVDAV